MNRLLVLLFVLVSAWPAAAQPTVDAAYQFQQSSEADGIDLPLGFAVAYSRPLFGRVSIGGLFDWSRGSLSDRPFGDSEYAPTINATRTQTAFGGLVRYRLRDTPSRAIDLQVTGGVVRSAERFEEVYTYSESDFDPIVAADERFTRPFVSGGVAATFGHWGRWDVLGAADYRLILMGGAENIGNLRVLAGIRTKI
jgi:hypothetical protein